MSTDCEQKIAMTKYQADYSYYIGQYSEALYRYQQAQRKPLLFLFGLWWLYILSK